MFLVQFSTFWIEYRAVLGCCICEESNISGHCWSALVTPCFSFSGFLLFWYSGLFYSVGRLHILQGIKTVIDVCDMAQIGISAIKIEYLIRLFWIHG